MKHLPLDRKRLKASLPKFGSAAAVAFVFLSVIALPSFTVTPPLVENPSQLLEQPDVTDSPALREETDFIHGFLTGNVQTEPTASLPPETDAPITAPPETEAPKTEAPETAAPEAAAPSTSAPETEAPNKPAQTTPPIDEPQEDPRVNLMLSDFEIGGRFYYDYDVIPLTREQQDIVLDIAEEYELPVELLYAIMRSETNFNPDRISGTDDYGIMQINKCNHDDLREALGVTNFLDFEQNVTCGAYMIHDCFRYAETLPQILMVYNRGPVAAWEAWEDGVTFDRYCERVIGHLLRYTEIRNAD